MTSTRVPPDVAERRQLAAERHKARHYAVQALYQWAINGNTLTSIEAHFREDFDFKRTDIAYFQELLHEVPAQLADLEAAFAPHLDVDIDKLGAVERAVLRLATYELMKRMDVPYKVVINEAVTLTRKFGAAESHRFVNGVLDKVARDTRSLETARG